MKSVMIVITIRKHNTHTHTLTKPGQWQPNARQRKKVGTNKKFTSHANYVRSTKEWQERKKRLQLYALAIGLLPCYIISLRIPDECALRRAARVTKARFSKVDDMNNDEQKKEHFK